MRKHRIECRIHVQFNSLLPKGVERKVRGWVGDGVEWLNGCGWP